MNDFSEAIVVKVGGSLYDLPDLGERLRGCLASLETHRILLVPGGGPTTDVVRDLDRMHHLGEEAAHWLALRSLVLNAHFLSTLLPGAVVVPDWASCPVRWQQKRVPILDVFAFAVADDRRPEALPHCWAVSSDSLAAGVAVVGGSSRLLLLKSVTVPKGMTWDAAARDGLIDNHFVRTVGSTISVQAYNLRVG